MNSCSWYLFLRWNRPWKTIHFNLRKKPSVAREHKKRNICNSSRTDFFWFSKSIVYSHCHVIAWHFREDLGPQLSHDATSDHLPEGGSNTGSMPCLFTFVVCDAWRVRDMREKMRRSNGRERPFSPSYADFWKLRLKTVTLVATSKRTTYPLFFIWKWIRCKVLCEQSLFRSS